jgi:hypothetical protein
MFLKEQRTLLLLLLLGVNLLPPSSGFDGGSRFLQKLVTVCGVAICLSMPLRSRLIISVLHVSFFKESTNLQVQNKFLKKISGPRADEVKLSFRI